MDRIPVEIWEKILLYATASPFLPFTESGGLSFHLVDNLDLFRYRCSSIAKYLDDSLNTVERLRLVCRSWAMILQPKASEYAESDSKVYWYPSKRAVSSATRLDLGLNSSCEHRGGGGRCAYRGKSKERIGAENDQEFLLRRISPRLRILFWRPVWNQLWDLPIEVLGSLHALSMDTDRMPGWWSLNSLALIAPHLSHLHLLVTRHNSNILSEVAVIPSLTYLSLSLDMFNMGEDLQAFKEWRFPSLHTLELSGSVNRGNKVEWENFLARHGDTITQLDASQLILHAPLSHFFTSADLWKLCPNITTIAGGFYALKRLQDSWESSDMPIPKLTLLVMNYLTRESAFSNLQSLVLVASRMDARKVVYVASWKDLDMTKALDIERSRNDFWLKEILEGCRKDLEDAKFPIVDRNDVPLLDIVKELI